MEKEGMMVDDGGDEVVDDVGDEESGGDESEE